MQKDCQWEKNSVSCKHQVMSSQERGVRSNFYKLIEVLARLNECGETEFYQEQVVYMNGHSQEVMTKAVAEQLDKLSFTELIAFADDTSDDGKNMLIKKIFFDKMDKLSLRHLADEISTLCSSVCMKYKSTQVVKQTNE